MAGQIRMTPDTMRIRAGEVNTQGEAVRSVITQMTNIMGVLQDEWDGQASVAFNEQFFRLKPYFEEMEQLTHNIGRQLLETAQVVEEADAAIASKFR